MVEKRSNGIPTFFGVMGIIICLFGVFSSLNTNENIIVLEEKGPFVVSEKDMSSTLVVLKNSSVGVMLDVGKEKYIELDIGAEVDGCLTVKNNGSVDLPTFAFEGDDKVYVAKGYSVIEVNDCTKS